MAVDHHVFEGGGLWLWDVGELDVAKVCQRAKNADFKWIAVKAHDGRKRFNTEAELRTVKAAAHDKGLAFGIWGYLSAVKPEAEATLACDLVDQYGAKFYIADVEGEYESASGPVSAQFVETFRSLHSHLPAAISSFGRIDVHTGINWKAWRHGHFAVMPQAYEGESTQLTPAKCVAAATAVWPKAQIFPTVGAYKGAINRPTPARLAESVTGLGVPGVSVWHAASATGQDLNALKPILTA